MAAGKRRRIGSRRLTSYLSRKAGNGLYTKSKKVGSTLAEKLGSNVMREQPEYELKVHLARDAESGRWYVATSDIPGLWLEGATPSELMERIFEAAPELIELNQEEIVAACQDREREREKSAPRRSRPEHDARPRPAIRPVFDSPFELAYAN